MTLDDSDYISNREAVERGAAADAARAKADWEEQKLLESDEAELAKWRGVFRRMAEERGEVHYDDKPGLDRRLHSVDGDLDREPVERMQHWLGDAS